MSRPADLVFRTNHPRVLFRSTDITALQSRSNNAGTASHPGWKTWWDTKALPQAASLESGTSVSTIANSSSGDLQTLLLAVTGVVDDISANRQKAIAVAKFHAANLSMVGVTDPGTDDARIWLSLLAWAYDILYDYMANEDRKQVGESLIRMCDIMSSAATNRLHGHAPGDQSHQAMGALALVGDTGTGYNFTTGSFNATTRLNEALDFWYGQNFGDPAYIDSLRYYGADGGSGKGVWYEALSKWYSYVFLTAYSNAVVSSTIDGDPYDPWVDESWTTKVGEWMLNAHMRGDGDYWKSGDTYRGSNPWFHRYSRTAIGALITRGGAWRKNLNWLYNQIQARADTLNQSPAYLRILDFLAFDPTNVDNLAENPVNSSPQPSKARLFDPPGIFFARSSWDIPNSTIINIQGTEFYYRNHKHLDVGSISISHKDDMVLLNSGYYHTTPSGSAEDFDGSHNNGWLKQSISHSGIPLIYDPNSSTPTAEHRNNNTSGSLVSWANGLGGQLWKEFGSVRDPDTIQAITGDASGMAWRLTGTDAMGTNKFRKVADNDDVTFLHMNSRRAYLRFHTDIDTTSERVRRCEHKILIIKSEGYCIFRVVHIETRTATMQVRDPWHFWSEPALLSGSVTDIDPWVFEGVGFRGTGKCVITYPNALTTQQGYSFRKVGNNSTGGYGAQQFAYEQGGTALVNYAPTQFPSTTPNGGRDLPDLGRWRAEIRSSPKAGTPTIHTFVCAIFALDDTGLGLDIPPHEIFEDADYYAIRFDKVPASESKVYKISKTEVAFVGGSDAIDTTPPSTPTSLVASAGVTSGRVSLAWNPNNEIDLKEYKIYQRLA